MPYDEYSLEVERLKRKRALAEALRNQALAPMDQNRMMGNMAIPISPLEGFSKMLQAYLAGKNISGTDKEEKELTQRYRTESDQAIARIMNAGQGNIGPVSGNIPQAPGEEYGMSGFTPPQKMGKPDIKMAVLAALQDHPNPKYGEVATELYLKQLFDKPDSPYSKINPADYTKDSFAKFAVTQNYQDLVPRDKLDFQNLGGSIQGLNPYTGEPSGREIQKTIGPDTAATLDQRQYEYGNLSAAERANIGLRGQEVGLSRYQAGLAGSKNWWETGQTPPPLPGGGGFVPPAPQMPSLPPGAQPTVPPVQGANIDAMLAAQGHPPEHIAAIKQVMAADQQGKPMSVTVDPSRPQQPFVPSPRIAGVTPKQESEMRSKEAEKIPARARVTNNLQNLVGYYQGLQKKGAMVDVNKGPLDNASAAFRASEGLWGVIPGGQDIGRVFGTPEQSLRNQINQLRPLLLNEIRQATQQGARGLDSNKELDFYLQAATDPARDIQANMAAIAVLDRAYGLGTVAKQIDEGQINNLKKEWESGNTGKGGASSGWSIRQVQ